MFKVVILKRECNTFFIIYVLSYFLVVWNTTQAPKLKLFTFLEGHRPSF